MQNVITELEQLTVTSSAKRFLRETAKWCKLLSIVGFIGIGLMLVIALFTGTMVDLLQSSVQKQIPASITQETQSRWSHERVSNEDVIEFNSN